VCLQTSRQFPAICPFTQNSAHPPQATLVVTSNPTSINVNGTSTLGTTGGSGSGVVSYSLVSGPCTLSGATLTGTGAGSCSVTATKAADSTYASATSSQVTVAVSLAPQATLVVTSNPTSINVNDTSTLGTTGGSGSGVVSYSLVSGPCTLSGATLTGTGAGSCSVTATKAADSTYSSATSSPVTVTVSGPPPVTNLVATPGPGFIRLTFTTNSPALASRLQPRTATVYTGTCTSSNGGVTASATGTGSPLTVSGTTAGKPYSCVVTGSDGSGSSSSATSNVVTPTAAPTPSPEPIPTLSEWAKISMMLLMVLTVGWYGRRLKLR
jgi:hypothetical protein